MRYRAIILDDDSAVRSLLRVYFDRRGYEVLTFPDPGLCPLHSATECACPAAAACADLIVSDVRMIDANGIEFLEKLIQKGCKQRNFALMSGDFSEQDVERAAGLGCVVFPKPLDFGKFTTWVQHVERSVSPGRVLADWRVSG